MCGSWNLRFRCHAEVTCDQTKSNTHGVFTDQNYRVWDLVRAHKSMIIGHFGLGMVWSEVTSVWRWYDQRWLQDENGLIRCGVKRALVWSEKILSAIVSDQRPFQKEIFSFDFLFCLPRNVGSAKGATKSSALITDIYRVWWFWSVPKASSWYKMQVPLKGNFD